MRKDSPRQFGCVLSLLTILAGATLLGAQESAETTVARPRHGPEPAGGIASEFVIGAFPGPPNGQINAARYREIADAGIDAIVPFWGTMDGVHNRDMLDLAHAAGLKVLAMDKRIAPLTQSADAAFDPSVIEAIARNYRDHPALLAYGVRDEPSADLFPKIARICRLFRRLDPAHPPLINLFPGYATPQQLATETYREYLLECVQTVKPAVLMYDHYPYKANPDIDTGWHRDLALFREISRDCGVGFWLFVQCQGIRGSHRVPTRQEIFRQGATALAYGARGVWWYRYWAQPPDPNAPNAPPQHLDSMIDRNGNRSPSYDYVRDANRFLRQAGPALIGWDNTDLTRIQSDPGEHTHACPSLSLTGENLDLVIGTFERAGTTRLVLANDDYQRPATFCVTTPTGLEITRIIASHDATAPSNLNAAAGHWSLGPAGCVVIELYPPRNRSR